MTTSPAATTATVRADSYLTLHYRVGVDAPADSTVPTDADDESARDVIGTFGSRPATLQLGAGQLSPALEERLIGLEVGQRRVFALAAGQAFGPRNPQLVQRLSRDVLEREGEGDVDSYSPGDVVEFNAPGGGRYAGVFRALENGYAVFDFNHPLAGQAVRFEVEILGIL